jgi:hypothetical protein
MLSVYVPLSQDVKDSPLLQVTALDLAVALVFAVLHDDMLNVGTWQFVVYYFMLAEFFF